MLSSIQSQFPILNTTIAGKPLIYLDNAATTQKPLCVLNAMTGYYETKNANIHRGAHYLSRLATEAYEQARDAIADFLFASSSREIIFTSGTTASINLVAQCLSDTIQEGDEILVSMDSHHSNIVPWQMLCERRGARLRPIPLKEDLSIDVDAYHELLNERTRILAIPVISNATGVLHPVASLIADLRRACPKAIVLLDGAQCAGHQPINVKELDCDFYAFSGHKLYAGTGTGVLWGREELLEMLPPWQGGGEMIREVRFEKTTYNDLPFKFEAGTPNIEGNIVLAEATRFVRSFGVEQLARHEESLITRLCAGLSELGGVRILGTEHSHTSLVSILVEGVHHYDLGMILDQMGIAVRTGHHCCQPLMHHLAVTGTTRYSVALYNTEAEIDATIAATARALNMLR